MVVRSITEPTGSYCSLEYVLQANFAPEAALEPHQPLLFFFYTASRILVGTV